MSQLVLTCKKFPPNRSLGLNWPDFVPTRLTLREENSPKSPVLSQAGTKSASFCPNLSQLVRRELPRISRELKQVGTKSVSFCLNVSELARREFPRFAHELRQAGTKQGSLEVNLPDFVPTCLDFRREENSHQISSELRQIGTE